MEIGNDEEQGTPVANRRAGWDETELEWDIQDRCDEDFLGSLVEHYRENAFNEDNYHPEEAVDAAVDGDVEEEEMYAPFAPTSSEPEEIYEPTTKPEPSSRRRGPGVKQTAVQSVISPQTRLFLQTKFPALDELKLWGLFEFLFFVDGQGLPRIFRPGKSIQTGRRDVAKAVGKSPTSNGFSLVNVLEQFSKNVIPLEITPHDFNHRKETTVIPRVPKQVQKVLAQENRERVSESFRASKRQQRIQEKQKKGLSPSTNAKNRLGKLTEADDAVRPLVCTVTGQVATPQVLLDLQRDRHTNVRKLLSDPIHRVPDDHPGKPFVELLYERNKGRKAKQVFMENLGFLEYALDSISDNSPKARRRDLASAIIAASVTGVALMTGGSTLMQVNAPIYVAPEGSPRLFIKGACFLRLPREYRTIAYKGCREGDLKACQLGIISGLWNIPTLRQALDGGLDIWEELAGFLNIKLDLKPVLKQGIYSIVFGGAVRNIKAKMQANLQEIGAMSSEEAQRIADKFFQHPLIQDVLVARIRQAKKIAEEGFIKDAFKRRKTLKDTYIRHQREGINQSVAQNMGAQTNAKSSARHQAIAKAIRSLMAYQVQSYELRFMLSLLPVIKKDSQIYPLGFLFDSIIFTFGSFGREDMRMKQMQDAVKSEAKLLGMPVKLEFKMLRYKDP